MYYYKAARNSIVTLEPLPNTINNESRNDVANSLHAKFRCNRAKVISIINPTDGKTMEEDISIYDEDFIYKTGKIVCCPDFDDKDINKVCSDGIHYFKTKETAVSWFYQNTNYSFQNGKRIGWYENGSKQYERSYKKGKRDGTWTWWYESGSKESEGSYKDGKEDGTWTWWYESGSKESEGSYKDGKRYGTWTWWYEDGSKQSEESYKNGKRNYK